MTKKEFVLQVTEQFYESPRKFLAGHGISAAVLQQILKRKDILGKLVEILWTLKAAKKGANGLKKSKEFRIRGYKNFPEMNMKAREDIETFVAGLSEADMEKFNNNGNVITILALPQAPNEVDDTVAEIVTGESVILKFDSAVRKEYKIPGGMYLVVMVADSAVRPAEEKIALRKAKNNAKKNKRRTVGKVKQELKAKAKKLKALQAKAYTLGVEAQQHASLRNEFGDDIVAGIEERDSKALRAQMLRNSLKGQQIAARQALQRQRMQTSQSLKGSGVGNAVIDKVLGTMTYKKPKKNVLRSELLNRGIEEQVVDSVVGGKKLVSGTAAINARRNEINMQIRKIKANIERLNAMKLEGTGNRASIASALSKAKKQLVALNARKNALKTLGENKAQMLASVNAEIENLVASGATVQQALTTAVSQLQATPQQKQQVIQQVRQQILDGIPAQYAVQQAIQQLPVAQNALETATLADDYDMDAILNAI